MDTGIVEIAVNVIDRVGVAIAVIGFFMWRDIRWISKLNTTLERMGEVNAALLVMMVRNSTGHRRDSDLSETDLRAMAEANPLLQKIM